MRNAAAAERAENAMVPHGGKRIDHGGHGEARGGLESGAGNGAAEYVNENETPGRFN